MLDRVGRRQRQFPAFAGAQATSIYPCLGKMSGVRGKTNSLLARPPVPIEDGPPGRDSLFQSRPVRPNRCNHGQTFEGAHSGRSPVQADAEGTAGHRKWAGYGGLRRRWSCCSCKDRSVKRTSIGQRGGRQEGQDQARHKIEIAPNLILNARRELVWINVTAHPTAEWIAQQITEAFPWSESPRYLIRDRDAIYGAAVTRRLRAMGIRDKPIAPGSPWQNTFAERLIGSIRRDCVDHMVVLGEAHLRRCCNPMRAITTKSERTDR
jgi:hypothetical protein